MVVAQKVKVHLQWRNALQKILAKMPATATMSVLVLAKLDDATQIG